MEEGFVFRGCQLPPGFRFQPTDQEIIVYYLKKKIAATATAVTSIIADVDIYKLDPWELPEKAVFGEGEWFFFSPRDRKYPNGARPNRTAGSGYWKAMGTDKPILASGGSHCLGVKKALVFYQGRSPKGTKTEWVMHEYRLLDTDTTVSHKPHDSMRLDDWVLCRVRKKGVSFPPEMEDKTEPSHAATVPDYTTERLQEEDVAPNEPDNAGLGDWNDGQFFQYLLDGSQDTMPGAGPRCPGAVVGHDAAGGGCGETSHTLASVLESIKRNLSFQAIDELYLLQPSKRANRLRDGDDEQLSPPFSLSDIDEVF